MDRRGQVDFQTSISSARERGASAAHSSSCKMFRAIKA
jgi:hypothetical protein